MERQKSIKTFGVGSANGILIASITQPFEVLRTSMILSPHKTKAEGKITLLHSIRTINQKEGVRGFFRGYTPALLRKFLASGIYFAGLQKSNEFLRAHVHNKLLSDMIAGNIARTIENIITNPLLVIETRYEVIGFNEYSSIAQACKNIYSKEGIKAFAHGVTVTVLRDIPGMTIFYPLYEKIKQVLSFNKEKPSTLSGELGHYALSSFIATGIAVLISQPLDMIATRIRYQFHNINKEQIYNGMLSAVERIVRNEGISGLFKGFMMRFMKKCFSSVLTFSIYDIYTSRSKRQHKIE